MEVIIRKEEPQDYTRVIEITELAFRNLEFSQHNEDRLVENLRQSETFIPELSLVAEIEGRIVGHILFTSIKIRNEKEIFDTLSLAPVSVHPDFQRMGIGKKLVSEGLNLARNLGFTSVIVVGHANYYPKFGFEPASKWNIKAHFEVPDEVFMAIELRTGALKDINGYVEYPAEFGV